MQRKPELKKVGFGVLYWKNLREHWQAKDICSTFPAIFQCRSDAGEHLSFS